MGITVIGGMLAASFIAIFLIPVTFYVVEKLGHKGDTGAHPPSGGEAEVREEPPSGHDGTKEGEGHA
jgi:HAE1 family hydrophobic/amphiphilic exporter-1